MCWKASHAVNFGIWHIADAALYDKHSHIKVELVERYLLAT